MTLDEIRQLMAYGQGCMNEDQYHDAVKSLLQCYDNAEANISGLEKALELYMKMFNSAYEKVVELTKWKMDHLNKSSPKEAIDIAVRIGMDKTFREIAAAVKVARDSCMVDHLPTKEAIDVIVSSIESTHQEQCPQETVN